MVTPPLCAHLLFDGIPVEAHLLEFDADVYGQWMAVEPVRRLRGERRFETADGLIEQMHLDVEEARNRCASFSQPPGPEAGRGAF